MQVVISEDDAIRVTEAPSITGEPLLMLWVNDRPMGFVSKEEAARLREVVKDPSKIGGEQ